MTNLFRQGFTNVDGEKAADSLPVTGEIPVWLRGSYITNGPAIFDLKGYSFNHWFDGLAMLTCFSFSDGKVGYLSRFIRGEDYKDYEKTGTVTSQTFATDGRRKGLDRITQAKGGDNANVNVIHIGGHFFAMDESAPVFEFDLKTLETKEKNGYPVEGQVTTAHPIHDIETGETVNYTIHFGMKTTYNIFALDHDIRIVRNIASVPVKEPSYMHSFAMTPHYVILTQNPLVANSLSFIASQKAFIDHYSWKPELRTRFLVVPRAGGSAMIRETDPLFCYHHVKAFEKDGTVCCDLIRYPDSSIVSALRLDNLRSDRPKGFHVGKLTRFIIPLDDDKEVKSKQLSEVGLEFPKIDPRRGLRDYRYVYGAGQIRDDETDFLNQLVKIDVLENTTKTWASEGCYPGEPFFVPRPESATEDEGVILSNVFDSATKKSFLLLLNAMNFLEIARIDAPQKIPFKFHGNFFKNH